MVSSAIGDYRQALGGNDSSHIVSRVSWSPLTNNWREVSHPSFNLNGINPVPWRALVPVFQNVLSGVSSICLLRNPPPFRVHCPASLPGHQKVGNTLPAVRVTSIHVPLWLLYCMRRGTWLLERGFCIWVLLQLSRCCALRPLHVTQHAHNQ